MFWSGTRVTVTGGSGFLGRNMIPLLRARGAHVDAPNHLSYDLTRQSDVEAMYRCFRPQVVIHMAGLVGGIQANLNRPADFFHQNLLMGTLLMQSAYQHGVEKFVAVAAGCGYPESAPIPIKETDLWNGYPQAPSAPYSLAKRMLVVQAQAMFQQYGFKSVIAMPGNLYGQFDNFNLENAHVIPALVRKFVEATGNREGVVEVWGSGKATRDFVYARDVCEGLLHIAGVYDKPELVNLSSGVESSIAEVVEILRKLTGFKGAVAWDRSKPDGQLRRCFDVSKAKSIGWQAETSLADGLERTVRWFEQNYHSARK